MVLDKSRRVPTGLKDRFMHGATAGCLTLPYLTIINPLERFVRAEDQTGDKPADMLKPFPPTKDPAKAFHPLNNGLWHTGDWQHSFILFFLSHLPYSPASYLFLPVTFQVVFCIEALRLRALRGTFHCFLLLVQRRLIGEIEA